MSTFVLVHGAWHGAWAWEKVVPLLEKSGHRVVALDLPGHGDDGTPPKETTLGGYAERVVGALDSLEGPAVVVGHSMGGMTIGEAAERRPEEVGLLVYACAYLPPNGVSALEMSQRHADADAPVMRSVRADEERGEMTIDPSSAAREALYGECSEEDAARAQLRPEPIAPGVEAVSLTEANYGRVPRAYVACLRDRTITSTLQREMYTETPCREVVTMDTDHSPFLSRPAELARHLVSLTSLPKVEARATDLQGHDEAPVRVHETSRSEGE